MNFLISLLITLAGAPVSEVPKAETCECTVGSHFPTPPSDANTLFYVQRTPNTNTIMYAVNLSEGEPDEEDPVSVYWLRYGEQGQKEDLSYIQQHYAYGLKTKKLENNTFELRFVSYKKLPFYLTRSARDNRYHILATVNGKQIEVSRVFLQIEGGTFWFPNVVCAQVKGVDPSTGKEIIQTFKP
ncbi:DUF4833 domain-containing protein [Chryseolinea lacunae]|uniref:DUF4833 domain-containing protein n=1 Tax=Chryseolinea lacunae TaxID=2801331 RepID=A0ABS1KK61_9BACT|nr:DUF4833 domain-containing protein [Chryseolinea lacunae]MBL0739632.1 DUF4833 domain-containing protein [Chryseolinea lacunae]